MKRPSYKHYLLGVLLVVLASNTAERVALSLVLQDVKAELGVSDTQLGLLTGIAFALFYALMGIPIARWADRGNRVTIITLTTALWSVAMALCSLVGNFYQLLLVRIGAAVGEAGCIPPAHSLMADHFNRAERPRAMAIYMLGTSLSSLIGFFAAGWLNELYGWRMMFLLLGLPGLALAALVYFTLREPRRANKIPSTRPRLDHAAIPAAGQPAQPRLNEVLRFLWVNTTFRHVVFCFSVLALLGSGVGQWQPTFFIRTYGLQSGELGTWFGLIWGIGTTLGLLVGGELATRFAANDEARQLKLMSFAYVGFSFTSALIYLSPNHYWAFAFMAVGISGASLATAPLFAMIQTLVPDRMRATALATLYMFANLIGMGLGPLIVGGVSDALRPAFGEESLRYALLAISPAYAWAAWHVWCAQKSVTADLKAVQLQADLGAAAQGETDVMQGAGKPQLHASGLGA